MSITFHPELTDSDLQGYRIWCPVDYDGAEDVTVPADYEAAVARAEGPHPCCDDRHFVSAYWGEVVELNVANTNGLDLLRTLGYEGDADDLYCGSADPDDLIGRILVALAIAPDPELPGYTLQGGGATVIDCGRPAGYLHDRLERLLGVAEAARGLGRRVVWG